MKIAVIAVLLLAGCSGAGARDRPTAAATAGAVDATTGLYINEVQISDLRLWRYDPKADRWERQPPATVRKVLLDTAWNPATESPLNALLLPPDVIGLYWMSVTENDVTQSGFVFKGRVACNDLNLGQPPAGRVPACVPFENTAKAQFVPDPKIHCK